MDMKPSNAILDDDSILLDIGGMTYEWRADDILVYGKLFTNNCVKLQKRPQCGTNPYSMSLII